MRHACPAAVVAILLWTLALPALSQTGVGSSPPPMIFAVPRLQLGGGRFFDGVDVGLAVPISTHHSVTGDYLIARSDDRTGSATYNYELAMPGRVALRASAGLMQDHLGFGVSAHQAKDDYGVGAFARSVGGHFQAGVFLSTGLPWGVSLGKPLGGRATQWGDNSGNVADMGALAAISLSPRVGKATVVATEAAWYPRYAANWRRAGQDAQSAGASVSEFSVPAESKWQFEGKGAMRGGPVVVGDRVFIGGDAGTLYALRLVDGSPMWTAAVGSDITRAVTASDGRIYVGTKAGQLVCLRPPMLPEGMVGVEEWRFSAGAAIHSCPVVTAGGLIVFGADNGTCYALDRQGKLVWTYDTRGPVQAGISLSAGRLPVPDARSGSRRAMGVLYCASADGVLYALRESDGRPVWTFATGAPLRTAPAVCGDRVLVGNEEGVVYATEAASGRMAWRQPLGCPIHASLSADEGQAYAAGADGSIQALGIWDGQRLWRSQVYGGVSTQPVVTRSGFLLVSSDAGMLYGLRCRDGRIMWARNVQETVVGGPAISSRYLVFGGETGRVHAFTPGGRWVIDPPPAAVARAAAAASGEARGVEVVRGREGTGEAPLAAPTVRPLETKITAPPGQGDSPRPGAPPPGSVPTGPAVAGMTMLTRPNDDSQAPIQIADSSSVVISGQVPAQTQAVTVNDVPVDVQAGAFRTRVDFYGTGAYPLTIKFLARDGHTTTDRRIVIVSSEQRPAAAAPVFISPESAHRGNRLDFTLSAPASPGAPAVSVLEILNEGGRTVRAFAGVGGEQTFEWDGRDQLGKVLPDGQYVAVYTLKDMDGRRRSMCQPVILDSAGM